MPAAEAAPRVIRIVSYNVHRCLGTDGRLSPERIATVLAALEPDIVALQELDVGRLRSGHVDQAEAIAALLEMKVHFHPAIKVLEELFGDAILTALPMRLVKAGSLPHPPSGFMVEPRGALWVAIDLGGFELQVVNTHLGLGRRERSMQVAALTGPDWLGHPDCRDPVTLVGDFNTLPASRSYHRLARRLRSAHAPASFPSRLPVFSLDHAFVRGDVTVVRCVTPRDRLARVASDHLPLVVDLAVHREHVAGEGVQTSSAR
jgi:endonuclease/exonuclease/phosphatase family metal-dependent hydrolase